MMVAGTDATGGLPAPGTVMLEASLHLSLRNIDPDGMGWWWHYYRCRVFDDTVWRYKQNGLDRWLQSGV